MVLNRIIAVLTANGNWLDSNLLLSVAAGVIGGLGVVSVVHFFFMRPRKLAGRVAAPIEEKASDPFDHGSTAEQRRSFRRGGNPIEVRYHAAAEPGKQAKGFVVNRSIGGICIQTDRPVSPETELVIRPTNAPHIAPWVQVVVKNCREAEIGYELGCQFVKTPPWPVLMMFG